MTSFSDQLSDVLRGWVKVFMRRNGQDYKHFMDESGLSFSQVNTLMRLHFAWQADISDISEQMGITKAAASQLVEQMVRLGLLDRIPDPIDRRIKRLALTPKGHAMAEKLVDMQWNWVEQFTDSLTSWQREAISDALQVMTDAARNIDTKN